MLGCVACFVFLRFGYNVVFCIFVDESADLSRTGSESKLCRRKCTRFHSKYKPKCSNLKQVHKYALCD